jgi:hypothetical protein
LFTGVVSRLDELICLDCGRESNPGSLLLLLGGLGILSFLLETNPKSRVSFGVASGVLTEETLIFLVTTGVNAL